MYQKVKFRKQITTDVTKRGSDQVERATIKRGQILTVDPRPFVATVKGTLTEMANLDMGDEMLLKVPYSVFTFLAE